MKKERPILFSTAMIQAIQRGKKVQTRRVALPPETVGVEACGSSALAVFSKAGKAERFIPCPYGKPGDLLWVREAWKIERRGEMNLLFYRADPGSPVGIDLGVKGERWARSVTQGWRPSIHCPRLASRMTLEIVSVKAQRLRDMTETDALEEGIERRGDGGFYSAAQGFIGWEDPLGAFIELWDMINGGRGMSWKTNPWVWALTFRRIS